MLTIKRLLCPVDFSDQSRHALELAVRLAGWYKAEVTALHVVELIFPLVMLEEYPPPPPMTLADIGDEVRKELHRFVEPFAREVAIAEEVDEGGIERRILERSASLSADLLVLGTHGRGGFERLALGSIAEKVLRRAACPVLTAPPRSGPAGAGPATFQTILCPIDFSRPSDRALTYALSLAQEAGGRIILLHVLEQFADEEPLANRHYNVPEYRRALEGDARQRLDSAVPPEARDWCQPETIVSAGKAYREVLRVAGDRHADLIVMGVQGRGAIDLTLFGSTTQHVVRAATCPVLTLRAD